MQWDDGPPGKVRNSETSEREAFEGGLLCGWETAEKSKRGAKGPPPKPRQRLIFDRRPQNATERPLTWISLPSAALLRKKVLPPGSIWRGTGKDLENYYFSLKHCKQWWARHAVGSPLLANLIPKWLPTAYVGHGRHPDNERFIRSFWLREWETRTQSTFQQPAM